MHVIQNKEKAKFRMHVIQMGIVLTNFLICNLADAYNCLENLPKITLQLCWASLGAFSTPPAKL